MAQEKDKVAEKEDNSLAKQVRQVNARVDRLQANWRAFAKKFIASDSNGKIEGRVHIGLVALLASAIAIPIVIMAADIIHAPVGGTGGPAGFTLNESGDAHFGGSVTIDTNLVLGGALTSTGALDIAGALNVDGITSLDGAVVAGSDLNVTGNVSVVGTFNATGAVALVGAVTLTDSLTVNGAEIAGDDATIITNMASVEAGAYFAAGVEGVTVIYTNRSTLATNIVTVTAGIITAVSTDP